MIVRKRAARILRSIVDRLDPTPDAAPFYMSGFYWSGREFVLVDPALTLYGSINHAQGQG